MTSPHERDEDEEFTRAVTLARVFKSMDEAVRALGMLHKRIAALEARVTQGVEHPLSPEEPGHMAEAIEGEDAT